jgi:Na+/serine symporter
MCALISIPKTPEPVSFDGMLTVARTAIGLGIGMLLADRIKRPARSIAAIALVSVGALAAVPFFVKLALEQVNRTEWGTRARLRSIRADSGYRSEADAF